MANPDPRLVAWIKKAAAATGADPRAMLADALVESGGRFGAVGDGGTSFGPYQFHKGGALGSHDAAWANSYPAILNRAREFARLQVHGGKGAAAVQRPLDQAGYAVKVQGELGTASKLLGMAIDQEGNHKGPPTPSQAAAQAPQASPQPLQTLSGGTAPTPGLQMLASLAQSSQNVLGGNPAAISPLAGLIGSMPTPVAAAPPLPSQQPGATAPPAPGQPAQPGMPKPGKTPAGAGPSPVIGEKNGKLIGLPYQGTHKLYGNWESDNAIDIAAPAGTPVYATADGTISSQIGSLNSKDPHMAGMRVHVDSKGQHFYYQHLEKLVVKAGETVKKGQLLGYTGALNHLHFAVENGDPRNYYK